MRRKRPKESPNLRNSLLSDWGSIATIPTDFPCFIHQIKQRISGLPMAWPKSDRRIERLKYLTHFVCDIECLRADRRVECRLLRELYHRLRKKRGGHLNSLIASSVRMR